MSTWTSKTGLRTLKGAVLCGALLLAACVPGAAPRAGASGPARILDGTVAVAAPRGYCLDPEASHEDGETAVLFIGRCAGETRADAALITVAVGGPGSSGILKVGAKALADYFTSAQGRAALARDGRAQSVKVHQATVADGALILHLTDRRLGEYWRAVIGLRGRLVTISVTAPEAATLPSEAGRQLLDRSVAALRAVNPASAS